MKDYFIKKLIVTMSALMLVSFTLSAQRVVKGTIVDAASNEPLIGAGILVKGTTTGTVTDMDGNYQITVPSDDAVLQFTFLGYVAQEIVAGTQTQINVSLAEDITELSEIVVVGYGTVKKEDLTGAVTVVTSEDLAKANVSDFGRALQGKASGVIVNQSGDPSRGAEFKIRGVGTINADNSPLVVIDGIIGGDLATLNPQDIESIQVLKDASSAAIYGAQGANGVIIVTTKRGQSGKPRVTLGAYVTLNTVPELYNMMNADQYSDFYNYRYEQTGVELQQAYSDEFRQYYYGEGWQEGTNWQKELLKNSTSQNYYMNVSGGAEKSNFSISMEYMKTEGLLIKSSADRIGLRANSDFTINKFFKIGETLSVSRRHQTGSTSDNGQIGAWSNSLTVSPLMKVYNDNIKGGYESVQDKIPYINNDTVLNTGGNDKGNPLPNIMLRDEHRYRTNVLSTVYLEFQPVKWLTYKIMPTANTYFNRNYNYIPSYDTSGVRQQDDAVLTERYDQGYTVGLVNQLSFNKSFQKHNIGLTLVNDIQRTEGTYLDGRGDDFQYEYLPVMSQSDPDKQTLTGGNSKERSNAYLGRLTYDYNSRYLLTASLRRDGISKFVAENRTDIFPSLSAAWKISEDFLQNVDQITSLKLRAGWGQTGNAKIGNNLFVTELATYNDFSPVFGQDQSQQQVALALNELYRVGNRNLKWESQEMTNIGFDLNAFNGRFLLTTEYFYKKSNDLLLQRDIMRIYAKQAEGDLGRPYANIGEVVNKGIELDATYRKMVGAFNYDISASFTKVKNEITYAPEIIRSGGTTSIEGHTVGSLYGYIAEGIVQESDFDENGRYRHERIVGMDTTNNFEQYLGNIRYKDLNGDGIINDLDQTIIGKSLPDFTYSFTVNLMYKGFDLYMFFYGVQNVKAYNQMRKQNESFFAQDLDHNKSVEFANGYWTPERPSTEFVRADQYSSPLNYDNMSTWWVEDASYLRLQDVQLGYTMPAQVNNLLNISKLRLYVSLKNVFTLTKYSGIDPESAISNNGFDNGTYPLSFSISGGLNLDF